MRSLICAACLAAAALGPAAAETPPPSAQLILGGYPILRLRGDAGGLTPDQRIAAVTDRLTPLLGNPTILPSDVAVYVPPAGSRANRYPVIYVLGHRIVTVDPTAVTGGTDGKTPLAVATVWAKRMQQILPRVNWRPSNAPEPAIPPHPPLTVTGDFTQVGGQDAAVTLRDQVVMTIHGPQVGGMTAAERADLLTERLKRLANSPDAGKPDAVQVTPLPDGSATLVLMGTTVLTVTAAEAKAAGVPAPGGLAQSWAKNLRRALVPNS